MIYLLKTMDGKEFEISEEARNALLKSDGLCLISEINTVVNTRTISTISEKPGEWIKDIEKQYKNTGLVKTQKDNSLDL